MTNQPYKGIMKAKHGNELTYVKRVWHTVSIDQCLLIFNARRGKKVLN